MDEVTVGRIRHGGGYRRWAAAARRDGRGRSAAVVLRDGARQMLSQAIEAEVAGFSRRTPIGSTRHGRRRLVRNGHAPSGRSRPASARSRSSARGSATAAADDGRSHPLHLGGPAGLPAAHEERRGAAALAVPEGHLDRPVRGDAHGPAGAGRPGSVGDHDPAPGGSWQDEHERWQGRDLSAKRYVYVWADGVYFAPRLEHDRQCVLVLIGADASGKKELLAIDDGFRESEQSWHELLLRLRDENGLDDRSRARHRRRCARLLEGGAQGLADHAGSSVAGCTRRPTC